MIPYGQYWPSFDPYGPQGSHTGEGSEESVFMSHMGWDIRYKGVGEENQGQQGCPTMGGLGGCTVHIWGGFRKYTHFLGGKEC